MESPPELKDFKITRHRNKSTWPDRTASSQQVKGDDGDRLGSRLWGFGMLAIGFMSV